MKVAFLGLGVMGYPMAGHLQKGGLRVINLTAGTLICGFALWQFIDVVRRR